MPPENGFLVVDEKDWIEASGDQREWMVYKTLKSLDRRMQKLEKRTLIDKGFSFAGGVVGGAFAAIGIKWSG